MSKKAQYANLATFFSLYIAQTIPMSFFSTVIPVLMRQGDFSLSAIGLLQLIKLPWILKFLWAPMVDRYTRTLSHYKSYIITSELIYASLIFAVSFLDLQTNFYTIIPLIMLAFVASATQDIAIDALAVLSFTKRDKSLVNSMQSMGSFGGSMLGGGVLMLLFYQVGWNSLLGWLALFVLFAIVPLRLNKGLAIVDSTRERPRAKRADFIYFFTQKGIWRQVGFLVLCYSAIIGTLTMLKPYLVDLGYGIKQIGFMSGIVGTGTGVVTAWFGGQLVRRIGIFRSRIFLACSTILTAIWFMVLTYITPIAPHLYVAVILIWGCYGVASIIVYTTAMNCVREGREGTDFTVQTVITHFSSMLMAIFSGRIADALGYHSLYVIEVVLGVVCLLYVLKVFNFERDESNTTR